VSEKNAWLNLSTENPDWIFSELRNAAKSQWNQALEKIAVSGHTASFGTPATNKKILYTALYHSLLHPNVFSDVNGEYLGFDRAPHVTSPPTRIQYANFSGWDIYRTEIQLLAVLFPDRTSDMIQSLLNDANQCGGIPRWAYNNDETGIMVGDPGALLVANAYAFGAEGFDTALALDWLKRDGTDPTRACNGHPTRPGLAEYLKSGYLSDDAGGSGGSAATTLEYNAADFAIARFARTLGDPQTEKTFLAQSTGWKKLYNPSTGYLEPRNQDGSWLKNFTATSNNGFVEGNAAQYTWAAPFDFSDLIQTLGGAAKTVARLDTFFTQLNVGENFPYFWVGDEPTFVTPWIYNWAGAPAHTAEVLQRTLSQNFSTAPGGLPGNDDLGAMSAWYVWAALGLYPTAPGVGGFTVNPPVFGQVELHLDSGHVIRVTSDQKSPGAGAIRALTLDGVAIQKPWVSWAKLEQAKELHFSVISAQQALSLSLSPNWGSQ
jgi:predicted alpha-1,2-mannosidase